MKERALGGSETAALMVAQHLAKRGHHVTFFSPGHPGIVHEGVTYVPIENFPAYVTGTPHDVCIVSRQLDFFRLPMQAGMRFVHCHDLALKRQRNLFGGVLCNLDGLYVLSHFMKGQYQEVYEGLSDDMFVVTRNGVDLPSFEGLEKLPRDKNKIVYGSRPERGFEQALAVMERLARQGSPIRLYAAWYDNPASGPFEPYYQQLIARAQMLPNVTLMGGLTQDQWHREIATARCLIYPSCPGDFREISCIVSLEAMAAGTPVVAARKGALPESVPPQAGVLLGDEHTDPNNPDYLDAFAATVKQICEEDIVFRSMSFAARERGLFLDWSDVAAQWEADYFRRLADRTSNAWRLRRHFERHGDREALEGVRGEDSANDRGLGDSR